MYDYSIESFHAILELGNWQEILNYTTCDEAWLSFKCKFLGILNKVAPVKLVRIKQGTDPWMTGEVLHLIHEVNRSLQQFKKTKSNEWYDKYVYLRNQVQIKKTQAKSDYYVNKVEENKNQPKKLWETLKTLGTSSEVVPKTLA